MDEALLGVRAPRRLGDPPRVAGDRRRVARGHLIAGVEEVEDDPHEAVALLLGVGGELARGLGVALGLEQVALEARVGDEHDAGESDDGGADRGDEIDEDGGPAREGEGGRQQWPRTRGQLAVHPSAFQPQHVGGDEHDVERPVTTKSTITANENHADASDTPSCSRATRARSAPTVRKIA